MCGKQFFGGEDQSRAEIGPHAEEELVLRGVSDLRLSPLVVVSPTAARTSVHCVSAVAHIGPLQGHEEDMWEVCCLAAATCSQETRQCGILTHLSIKSRKLYESK